MRRLGRKKIPVFSIIATDSRNARDGRYIEDLGRYYPLKQPAEVQLDEERILYWLGNGAQPSDTVRSILSKRGLMLHHHLKLKGKSEAEIRDQVNEHLKRVAEKGDAIKITPKMRDAGALEEERDRAEQRKKEAEERADSLREEAVPLQDVSEAEEDGDAEDEAADDASEDDESAADAETAADGDDAEASADDHDADAPAETDEAEEGDEEADASAEEETSDDTDATGDAEASDEADADDEEEKDDT